MQRTRSFALIAVAALVLIAGCGGGGGGTATPTETATPTATPTPTPTVDSVTYPDGLSKDGYTNSSKAMQTFREGLASGPSYTTTMDVTVGSTTQTLTTKANPSEKKIYAKTLRNGNLSYELYYENETQYIKNVEADPDRYGTTNATFQGAIFGFNGGQFLTIISVLDLKATDVAEQNGATVITYEITGPSEGASDIKEASGTITVTTEGRLRSIDYTVTTTKEQTLKVQWTRTKLGKTTVPTPQWLSKATGS